MSLGLNSRSCRSGTQWFPSSSHVIRGFGCGSGLMLALGLVGCAGKEAPQIQYVRVEVPVQVPCRVPEVAVPPWAADSLRKTDSLEVKVRALLAERLQRIGYEKELGAALTACQ